jgi:hypothetical protein
VVQFDGDDIACSIDRKGCETANVGTLILDVAIVIKIEKSIIFDVD